MVAGYWLRPGNTACVNGAAGFLRQTLASLPAHLRIGLLRGDAGFGDASVQDTAEELGLKFILVARLTQKVQTLCRHGDEHWQPTEVEGLEVQEVGAGRPGRRRIVIRQRVAQRPEAGGKTLIELPGYRFQALATNLPASVAAVAVWRRYNGRADIENRIKELGRAVWDQAAVLSELLGDGGDASVGHRGLQPLRVVAAAAGAVGEVRVEYAAVAVVWTSGGVEPGARQTDPATGGA